MKNLLLLLLASFVCWSCQNKPTKTYLEEERRTSELQILDQRVVLIDARPAFQHSLAHPSGAIPMKWEDFSQKEAPFLGLLEPDLFFHARRLARLGIGPDSEVLILGNGEQGHGEEGRIAWTLQVLGVTNVKIAHVERLKFSGGKDESPPRRPVQIWKPMINDSLLMSKVEFEAALYRPRLGPEDPLIVDVRDVEEYLGKSGRPLKMDYGAINIPWTEFISSQGEADPKIEAKLFDIGITKTRKVILVDWRGVRSALACHVLRGLGFNAVNFAGGYDELESAR